MPDEFAGRNRRRGRRQDTAFTITYGVEAPYSLRVSLGLKDDLDAVMQDLSEFGMAFVTQYELSRGSRLQIKFNFINLFLTASQRGRRMEVEAEVSTCKNLGKGNYRIGVSFSHLSEQDKTVIRDFIKRSQFGGSNVQRKD